MRLPLVLLALALLLPAGCRRAEPERTEDLEGVIRSAVASVAARDVQALLRHVSVRFEGGRRGAEADLDFAAVRAVVLEFLQREHPIAARLEELRVTPANAGARRAELRIWFAPDDALLDATLPPPASASGYHLELDFERREGTWQAVRGGYERFRAPQDGSGG